MDVSGVDTESTEQSLDFPLEPTLHDEINGSNLSARGDNPEIEMNTGFSKPTFSGELNENVEVPATKVFDDAINAEADRILSEASMECSKDDDDNDGWIYVLGNSQLKKRTIKPGMESTRPGKGQMVTVRCVGRLDDGTEVDKHDRLRTVIGDDDFVQAFDLCIALMNKGELCEIMTEARFAYGELGREPDVPPNSRILYEVELLGVEDEAEFHTLTVNYRLQLSDEKRQRGNFLYSRGEFSRAVDVYAKAMKIVDNDAEPIIESPEELSSLADMRIKCCNNLAAAQLKLEAWDAAIKSCDSVLLAQPTNVKAMFRKAKCFAGKGDYDDAIGILTKASKLEPDAKIIHQELTRLVKISREQNQSRKELYQKMMGTDKEPFLNKTSPLKTKSVERRWVWYVVGALASMAVPLALTFYKYLYNDFDYTLVPENSRSSPTELFAGEN